MKKIILKDVVYGSHERHVFDMFIPEDVEYKDGVILFIHGGGWHDGDKTIHHPDAEYFSDRGCICATMNYRFVSEDLSVFNELDDITSALKAIKEKCTEYGFDIEKVILSGGSAGGHLSLLYAYTRHEESTVKPVASCVYCPPVALGEPDFLMGLSGEFEEWKFGILSKCCGFNVTKSTLSDDASQKALMRISPINYVGNNCIPTAVFYGKSDELIPERHIEMFLKKLAEKGVKYDSLLYENSGHALDKDPEAKMKSRNIIEDYLKMYFQIK